jgi:hypothetical protein
MTHKFKHVALAILIAAAETISLIMFVMSAAVWLRSERISDRFSFVGDRNVDVISSCGKMSIDAEQDIKSFHERRIPDDLPDSKWKHDLETPAEPLPTLDGSGSYYYGTGTDRYWALFGFEYEAHHEFAPVRHWVTELPPEPKPEPIPEGMPLPVNEPPPPSTASYHEAYRGAGWGLTIPYWVVTVPAGMLSWIFGKRVVKDAMSARRKRKGLCRKCGYDLRASTGRCPECGATIG